MPDCSDQERRNLILTLAHDAVVEAVQTLLENAVRTQDSETIETSQRLLEYALGSETAGFHSDTSIQRVSVEDAPEWAKNLTWTGLGYVKTVENVLAKGVPLPVKAGQCKIEDCVGCFWENICSREETQKLIDRSRELLKSLREHDAKADERASGKPSAYMS